MKPFFTVDIETTSRTLIPVARGYGVDSAYTNDVGRYDNVRIDYAWNKERGKRKRYKRIMVVPVDNDFPLDDGMIFSLLTNINFFSI